MSKIIPFDQLARAQHLNFLEHKRRDYQEREDYLARLRRLLFQIEGQMRQTEVQQLDVFLQAAKHFQVNVGLPIQGDRLAMQQAFTEDPFLASLSEFLTGRLTAQECLELSEFLTGRLTAQECLEKIDLVKEKQKKK